MGERARLAALMVAPRRDDWLLGRVTAKRVAARALAELFPADWPPGCVEIASEPCGRPFARLAAEAAPLAGFTPGDRLPISVSISHIGGHALCAATRAAGAAGTRMPGMDLGVDLGVIEPRSNAFLVTFFTDAEQDFVRNGLASERSLRANLVWCAKEAALKAVGRGLTVDTRDLCCLPEPGRADPGEWPLEPADDGWRPFVARCGDAVIAGGAAIRGVWRAFPGLVATLASTAAPPLR